MVYIASIFHAELFYGPWKMVLEKITVEKQSDGLESILIANDCMY